jgi:hypothetical protein
MQTHAPQQNGTFRPLIGTGAAGLFGQPCFPKTLDQQLLARFCEPGRPSDHRRYCKGGIELKHARRRLTRLSVTTEMGESRRQAAVDRRIGEVLTKGLLSSDDGLVKAAKLDKGLPNASKRHV